MPIPTAEERIGTVLGGRYRLESILGTGGTSVVYAAKHSFTGRRVALKILKHEHGRDRGLVSRFLNEARIASTLVHPNVVAILDMGTEAGDTYLAMELVVGDSLAALLAGTGPLSLERTLSLLRPVMEAVEAAHARGIVHRDLKPDNVIVGDRGDGSTRAILLDFGMAKTSEAAWGHMTQSGVLVGTPLFMSPEQAEGAADVGAASDVWSMGVTLYRCLSGELPFVATNPTALLLAIARGQHVSLGERMPSLGAPIAAWVEGALLVDRARRYPDMTAMLAALDRALAGEMPIDAGALAKAEGSSGADGSPPDTAPRASPSPSVPEGAAVVLPSPMRARRPAIAIGVVVSALFVAALLYALRVPAAQTTAVVPEARAVAAPPVAVQPDTAPSVAATPEPDTRTATVEAPAPATVQPTVPAPRDRPVRRAPPPEAHGTTTQSSTGLATEW